MSLNRPPHPNKDKMGRGGYDRGNNDPGTALYPHNDLFSANGRINNNNNNNNYYYNNNNINNNFTNRNNYNDPNFSDGPSFSSNPHNLYDGGVLRGGATEYDEDGRPSNGGFQFIDFFNSSSRISAGKMMYLLHYII